MLTIITSFFLKLSSVLLKPFSCIKGQSIAEFAVITAMMSTFVATAAPRLSNLMEEGKTQKSIQEIDKLLMQAKNFYEFTSNLEVEVVFQVKINLIFQWVDTQIR